MRGKKNYIYLNVSLDYLRIIYGSGVERIFMDRYEIAMRDSKKSSYLYRLRQHVQVVTSNWPKWKRQIAGLIEKKYEKKNAPGSHKKELR